MTQTSSSDGRRSRQPSAEVVERHPHLGRDLAADRVRVDMHSHTMWSGDCTTTPDEIVEALDGAALDVVCITDHHAIEGAIELFGELPCRVVVGEEMRTHHGELIGLFLTERVPQGLNPVETAKRIRDQGALVYVPHPFDPMRNNLAETALLDLVERDLVDAIEVFNAKTALRSLNERAADFADEHGLLAGAGSDAHVAEAFGAAYVEMPDFDDAATFLTSLAQANPVGHQFDPPRKWLPRIVPSTSPT